VLVFGVVDIFMERPFQVSQGEHLNKNYVVEMPSNTFLQLLYCLSIVNNFHCLDTVSYLDTVSAPCDTSFKARRIEISLLTSITYRCPMSAFMDLQIEHELKTVFVS